MTNKEAKEVIQNHLNHWERLYREKICTEEEGSEAVEAFSMAIKALEAQSRHADVAEATSETAKLLEEGYFERRLPGGADVRENRTSDAVSREAAEERLGEICEKYHQTYGDDYGCGFGYELYHAFDDLPSVTPDAVSLGVFEQVKWERDVAIEQLKELGYGFGEKPRNDTVSMEMIDAIREEIKAIPNNEETKPIVTYDYCLGAKHERDIVLAIIDRHIGEGND